MEIFQTIHNSPIVSFTILLLVVLIVPPIFERLKLPGLVGLIAAGVILGPDVLKLLDAQSEIMVLLSDIGKIYLMFVAGLEIDLAEFRKTKQRSLVFGIATFTIPLIVGTVVGRSFGMDWNASILIGSLLASHTLLGYPIVNRLGVVKNQAVVVTIGATIFTDIAALLVLAICVSIGQGEFSTLSLIGQLVILGVYAAVVLFGIDWLGKEYFRRTGDQQSNQFLFVLLAVFLASVGAQIINVDKIVGAFLAGLAINDVVGHSPVEEKIEFVGSTLFIPFFFVGMGLLLNISGLTSSLTSNLLFTTAIVVGLCLSKFIAASVVKLIYRYNWNEALTMWSLSLPQVAATLAAALVGVQSGVIESDVFNSVIVLMLVTAVGGPVMTAQFAKSLSISSDQKTSTPDRDIVDVSETLAVPFNVVVPVYNPRTERNLIELGSRIAHHEAGKLIALSIAKAHVHMDAPEINVNLRHSRQLLKRAVKIAAELSVNNQTMIRIDDDVAHGISRAAREQNASLIVMGISPKTSITARLFGNVVDSVFWAAHCPVAVCKLLDPPTKIKRILVPIKSLLPKTLRTIRFASILADSNDATITLLHVCSAGTSAAQADEIKQELTQILNQQQIQSKIKLELLRSNDVAKAIARQSKSYDLTILRSIRRRTVGGLAVSSVTSSALKLIECSVILFGEPHS